MKKPLQILLAFLLLATRLSASDNYPVGARQLALANAGVSLSDVWGSFHNQATLAGFTGISAGIFYESKFLIDELSLAAGTFVFPALSGSMGFSYRQFGQGSYKEIKTGLAYARQLSKRLNAGLQFDYFSTRFPENDRALSFVTFELGLTFKLSDELTLGTHVFNPVNAGFETRSGKLKMPLIVRAGGHYSFSNNVLLLAEIEKNAQHPVLVKSGLEFVPHKNLAFRLGVSGAPWQVFGGLGYRFGKVSSDIAFSYHGNLGFSPSVSLQFDLK